MIIDSSKLITTMVLLLWLMYLTVSCSQNVDGFTQIITARGRKIPPPINSPLSASLETTDDESSSIQWELLNKHHAKGSWKGIWTTYDYIGDVIDETVASVDLNLKKTDDNDDGKDIIEHTHTIFVDAKRSDCKTCFDSMESKILPVSMYTPENIQQKCRLAGQSMVNGPSLLRSGVMATELILRHKDGRVRVIYQFAPVWERDIEPGSCPPQGLKLFRTIVSREALRSTAPTAETEADDIPEDGNPIFYRPVPPFNWHKKWSGTAWTYGQQTGDKGWAIDELEETDSWHGITPVDCWNLRLPGGIHLQAPRVITGDTTGICRLAWLPTDETLLRVEAGVSALQPMVINDDDMVGFHPPSLTSIRCDMMSKTGELENATTPSRKWNNGTSDEDVPRSNHDSNENNKTVKTSRLEESSESSPTTPRDHLSL